MKIDFLDNSITDIYPLLRAKFSRLKQINRDFNFTEDYIDECGDTLIKNLATETYFTWCELIKNVLENENKEDIKYGTIFCEKYMFDKLDITLIKKYNKPNYVSTRAIIFASKKHFKDIKNILKNNISWNEVHLLESPVTPLFLEQVNNSLIFAEKDFIGKYPKDSKVIPCYPIINYNDKFPLIVESDIKDPQNIRQKYLMKDLINFKRDTNLNGVYEEIIKRLIKKANFIKRLILNIASIERLLEIIKDPDSFLPDEIKQLDPIIASPPPAPPPPPTQEELDATIAYLTPNTTPKEILPDRNP